MIPFQMRSDERLSPEHIAILQKMTPQQKYDTGRNLYWMARKLKTAYLKDLHPDWSDEKVNAEVRRIFMLSSE